MKKIIFSLLFTSLIGIFITTLYKNSNQIKNEERVLKNAIWMIPTGLGLAPTTFARHFQKNQKFSFDKYMKGTLKTNSANSLVSDSAAAATAFACGIKTNNDLVGLAPNTRPCKSIIQTAKEEGYKVGIITMTTLSHDVVGSFTAHVNSASKLHDIASQQITKKIDLLLGGGFFDYLPKSQGGRRTDGRNLFNEARTKHGYNVVRNKEQMLANPTLPMLGVFTRLYLPWELDRRPGDPDHPHLPMNENVKFATHHLRNACLRDTNCPGYFILVVAYPSLALKMNDPGTFISELKEFDKVFDFATSVARRFSDTLVLSTPNVEFGGLTLGRQTNEKNKHDWYPSVVLQQIWSGVVLRRNLVDHGRPIKEVYKEFLGITDLSNEEVKNIQHILRTCTRPRGLFQALNDRANINYSVHSPTGGNVVYHSMGKGSEHFTGHLELTDIHKKMSDYLFKR